MLLQQSHTAVLERHAPLSGQWSTEPFEAAWANKAIWFIRIEELAGKGTKLTARVQISPDGITWTDEGTSFPVLSDAGQSFVRVSHFGGWLRLTGTVDGEEISEAIVTIHLVMKE